MLSQTPGVFMSSKEKSNLNPGGLGFNFGLLRQTPGVFMSGKEEIQHKPRGALF
ncbi:protein of unknown function [Brevefilum fermentans]|uniref:Uncharacterized protein n=1 Tax=Candidatus Brevifilum fermentans TaxID=1986204 RepID=A0A1Y6K5Q9_9CHLR|nr:protein of unknown function [Brevefilum fermentans]